VPVLADLMAEIANLDVDHVRCRMTQETKAIHKAAHLAV